MAEEIGALPLVADAGNAEAVEDALAGVMGRFDRVDTLVCNAGGPGFTAVGETSDAEWGEALHANLTTSFGMARDFLPALVESLGRIVVVSSLSGLMAGPSMAGCTAAKHALIGLTKSLARDYGRHGVRVNAICPGWVRTPMADEEMDGLVEDAGLPSRQDAYDTKARGARGVPGGCQGVRGDTLAREARPGWPRPRP